MSGTYEQIQEALELKLLEAVELELGRTLTDAEAEKVRGLITAIDVVSILKGMP